MAVGSFFLHPHTRLRSVALLLGTVLLSHWALGTVAARIPDVRRSPFLPNGRLIKVLSLGYRNLSADLFWFRTLNDFGIHFRSDREYPWLYEFCDLITDIDPRGEHVYRFGGLVLSWEARRPEEGVMLLEKGVRNLPDSWYLSYLLGFHSIFFLNDYTKGIRYLERAASLPGAHPLVVKLATSVELKTMGPERALAFLKSLREAAGPSPAPKATEAILKDLIAEKDLGALKKAVRAFEQRLGRKPATVSELVGEGTLSRMPSDPYGGEYSLDPRTGEPRASRPVRPLVFLPKDRGRL